MTRIAALAALLLLLLPAAAASPYAVQGRAWPGGRILYYNAAPDQAWALGQAVSAWNASGAAVRFVPASRARAQVTIEDLPGSDCNDARGSVGGEAHVGYTSHSVVYVVPLEAETQKCSRFSAAQVLAHELGHVLGLGHETRGCATMNPSGTLRGPSLCPPVPLGDWACGLLEPDDVAGAVALYGGVARKRGPRACPLYAAIAAPRSLALAGSGVPGGVTATFVRPADPVLPLFLNGIRGQASFAVAVGRDACPTVPGARTAWTAQPGGAQSAGFDSLAAGRWCVAAWAYDRLGRRGARATAWIRMI